MEYPTTSETAGNQAEDSWFPDWLRWCPTSEVLLEEAEAKILKSLDITYEGKYVKTTEQDKIWTVSFNAEGDKTPVLMVHGFGAGLGVWVMNVKELSKTRPIYTFDLLGFGRSSRPAAFGEQAEDVEEKFVRSIEDTRKELGLESFILMGHSFGGYLAYSYAIKYPGKVKSLILVDPWGFSENAPDRQASAAIPKWIKVMAAVLSPFNPCAPLRLVGPLGPLVLRITRPDLQTKFESIFSDDTFPNYIYHCNVQAPSGETGFKQLTIPYLWPKYPMIHRIDHLNPQLKVSMLFGSRTRIDSSLEEMVAKKPKQFHIYPPIKNAGHYLFADRPNEFNKLVQYICEGVDGDSR